MPRLAVGLSLTLLLGLVLPFATTAQERTVKGFLTGNDFQVLPEVQQSGYVEGVLDMASSVGQGLSDNIIKRHPDLVTHLAVDMASDPGLGLSAIWYNCANNGKFALGFSNAQALAIVTKYLSDHPEKWNFGMWHIVLDAVTDACKQ